MARITIKDIARETGLSIATVSYVLNGKDNVLEETKKIVQDAALRLGYVKNYSARSLVMNTSNLLGVVIPQTEPGSALVFNNPFYSEILSSIEYHARQMGYHIILSGTDADKQYFDLARERNLDGIIIIGAYPDEFYEGLENVGIPMVLVDSYIDSKCFNAVMLDDYQSAYDATKYLIQNGHREIAFLSGQLKNGGVAKKRYNGFAAALQDAGYKVNQANVLSANTDFESGTSLAERLMKRSKVTAVFCTADIMALGVIKQLTEAGLRIPDDISVMGFDNLNIAKYCTPGLTTVGQDVYEKGRQAVELIYRAIKDSTAKPREVIIPTEIVIRESVRNIKDKRSLRS